MIGVLMELRPFWQNHPFLGILVILGFFALAGRVGVSMERRAAKEHVDADIEDDAE